MFAQFRNSVTGIVQYLEAMEKSRVAKEDERMAIAQQDEPAGNS